MASTSLRDLPTDEYFPATNAFLRSLAEPEPPRPPTASVRSRSAAASENWRVADAAERAATERAERAYRALEKDEGAAKASKRRRAKKAKAPPPPPAHAASPPETDTYGMYQPKTTPPHKAFQERQMSTLQLEAPGGVAGCFERAGWMCCVEDNRTSSRPHGKERFQAALALIPVTTREDAHLFREKVKERTTDNDGLVADAEDAEGRTLLWHAALHDDVQSAKVLLEQGCWPLILEPDYVHRLSPLQLAQKHSRRDLEDMFCSYVTARDRDEHWHHGRVEGASPPSPVERGFFS